MAMRRAAARGGAMSEPVVLQAEGLAKAFGGVEAVDDVSFKRRGRRLLALIGPNGAGKSTCFNMLNGQLRPTPAASCSAGATSPACAPRDVWRAGRRPHVPDRADVRLDDRGRERADGAAVASRPGVAPVGRSARRSIAGEATACSIGSACGAGGAPVRRAGLRRRQARGAGRSRSPVRPSCC